MPEKKTDSPPAPEQTPNFCSSALDGLRPSVVYREGPLTPEDYQEAIDFLVEAKQNLESGHHFCPCGDACSINSCHHNPLVMARREAKKQEEFRCFHCGGVFTTDEDCREHFGEKQDALPACLKNTALLIALVKTSVELAIIRNDLNSEEGYALLESADFRAIAEDTANAVRGIGTCAEKSIPEWQAFFSAEV